MGYHGSFTNEVRQRIRKLGSGGQEVTITDVARFFDLLTDKEKKPIYNAFVEIRKMGEIKRVRPGVYHWVGRSKQPAQKQDVMWRILRARQTVTIDDMMELSGAAETYVKEFFQLLERREVVKKVAGGKYRLIDDPVIMPRNKEKIRRLREIRKQTAIQKIIEAETALKSARDAVSAIDEEDTE